MSRDLLSSFRDEGDLPILVWSPPIHLSGRRYGHALRSRAARAAGSNSGTADAGHSSVPVLGGIRDAS